MVFSIFVFTMLFNFSIGITNAIGLFDVMLTPGGSIPGLDKEMCEGDMNDAQPGFNGDWRNVNGAGYKCYIRSTNTEMSVQYMDSQLKFVRSAESNNLVDSTQEAGVFQFTAGLLGQFGNAIRVIPDLFRLMAGSIAFPTQYLMALYPCPDTNYYKSDDGASSQSSIGVAPVALDTQTGKFGNPISAADLALYDKDGDKKITIDETPCIESPSVDGYELILGYIQSAMYILYFVFVIQLIANRGFRGMT